MAFRPNVDGTLVISDVAYSIVEHPAAPGIPYGQEGRQAVVYQLVAQEGDAQALKVFKPRHRLPALVGQAAKIAPLAELPGLQVCRRTVLSARRNRALLRQHPDLTYAILMPWVRGPTWMEVVLERREFTPGQSLELARSLAEMLATMEEQGLSHCDLSGPNVLLPVLDPAATPGYGSSIELVDVEQLYSSDLKQPELLPGGSPGYAHKTAPEGLWGSTADRFSGAVLLGEMLGWCDERVREAAWGENYFDPQEMQRDSERYQTLITATRGRWGENVLTLLERAWRSDELADCATFGEWLVTLPEEVPAVEASKMDVPSAGVAIGQPRPEEGTVTVLMELGRRLEEQGNVAGALEAYRQAQLLAPTGSGLAQELALIGQDLQAKQEEAVFERPQLLEQETAGIVAPAAQPAVEGTEVDAPGVEPKDEMLAEAVSLVKQLLPEEASEVGVPALEMVPDEAETAPSAPRSPLEEELALIAQEEVETGRPEGATNRSLQRTMAEELEVAIDSTAPEERLEEEAGVPRAAPAPQSPVEAELALIAPDAELQKLEESAVPGLELLERKPDTAIEDLSSPVGEEVELDRLSGDGVAAYERGEWAKARELLAEVVRRHPGYEWGGQNVSKLLAEAERQVNQKAGVSPSSVLSDENPIIRVVGLGVIGSLGLVMMLLLVVAVALYWNHQVNANRQAERIRTEATATARAVKITSTARANALAATRRIRAETTATVAADTLDARCNRAGATTTAVAHAVATTRAHIAATVQARLAATASAEDAAQIAAQPVATMPASQSTQVQTRDIQFEVLARQGWQDTGVYVDPGETLEIDYLAGVWTCDWYGSSQGGGAGCSDLRYSYFNVLKGCPHGALIARIKSDDPFCVGSDYSGQFGYAGTLQLRINETQISDNRGSITVRILVR